jgi:hypothetical protein
VRGGAHATAPPLFFALALAAALDAPAQQIFKCTSADGKVTYQETPCVGPRLQKRVDIMPSETPEDVAARRSLEREAAYGDELAGKFATEARNREREQLERDAKARAEELARAREKALREAIEAQPWMPPWGWPGRPGLARPGTRPSP